MLVCADHAVNLREPCVADDEKFHKLRYTIKRFFLTDVDFYQRQSYSGHRTRPTNFSMFMHSFRALLVLFAVFMIARPADAQNCGFVPEAIVNLRAPIAGSYNVWDTIHGDLEHSEMFFDALPVDGGNILMIGDRLDPKTSSVRAPFLIAVGRNGRVLWEKPLGIPGFEELVKMEAFNDGVIIMANVQEKKRDKVWIGAFKLDGERVWRSGLQAPSAGHLYGHDIVSDGKSLIVATTRRSKDGTDPLTTVFHRLNSKGAVIQSRAFAIGADNTIADIELMSDRTILGVGFANNASGRRDGWMMRVTPDFILNWQAPYPRGDASELNAVALLKKDQYAVAVGTALPNKEGHRAGWILTVEAAGGDVAWQRYFSGDLHFDGRDILTNKDGIISAILDGQTPEESDEKEHIRLLTLNPRGDLFVSDEYFNGEAVDAVRLFETRTHNRVILGSTRIVHRVGLVQDGDDAETKETIDAWAVAAPRSEPYEDPCIPKIRNLP